MGETKDPFDQDSPTKRHSGSLQRGPIWEGLSRMLAERMAEVESACKAELDRVPESHSEFGEATRTLLGVRLRSRIAEARAIAAEAAELARHFKAWERQDPGYEPRTLTLSKWHDLERRARAFDALEQSATELGA